VGRKATGPFGIAGLPKFQVSCRDRIAVALSKQQSGFCFWRKLIQEEIGESMENSTLFLILYENFVDQLRTDK
jgi:hypothetical protein